MQGRKRAFISGCGDSILSKNKDLLHPHYCCIPITVVWFITIVHIYVTGIVFEIIPPLLSNGDLNKSIRGRHQAALVEGRTFRRPRGTSGVKKAH